MNAIDSLLKDMVDYAGLYPPAGLDMHTAVRKYLEYGHGPRRKALGRFVVDLDRFPYLWDAAGDYTRGLRLSVIALADADWAELQGLIEKGYAIEAVEIKTSDPKEIERIAKRLPAGLTAYFEAPVNGVSAPTLDAIAAVEARIKIRMGGPAAGAIPSPQATADMLAEIARRRLVFKATAGLHHPVRGRHPLMGSPESPTAVMHGFMNLACAAAVLHFGGEAEEAREALEEEWPGAWQVTGEAIAWQQDSWNADELREVRQKFFAGFGSCSFEEPMQELEALGWL
jgi:hypothetical protein